MAQTNSQTKAETSEAGMTLSVQYGAPEGQDARLIARRVHDLAREKNILVHVALDDARLILLEELVRFFDPDIEIISFPAWDCLPYDRVSPNPEIVAQRITALSRLREWEKEDLYKPRLLLTTVNAVMQRVMPHEELEAAQLVVKQKGRLDEKNLQRFLVDNGYLRTDTVREAGEFARRGGIFDLFPPGAAEPLRIDMFGDEIETIRSFDPATQISTGNVSNFALRPVTEFFLDEKSVQRFRSAYRELFGVVTQDDPLYQAVSEQRRHAGMEHWLPLFFGTMETLFDYSTRLKFSFDAQVDQSRQERLLQIDDFFKARQSLDESLASKRKKKTGQDVSLSGSVYHPLPPALLYVQSGEFAERVQPLDPVVLQPFGSPQENASDEARRGRDFSDIRATDAPNLLNEVASYLRANINRKIIIACYSQGSRERLRALMDDAGIKGISLCENFAEAKKLKPGEVALCLLHLESGFNAPDLIVLTEQDILGDRLARKTRRRRKADNFLKEVTGLIPGDLVVHIDHGVGRFEGLETLKAAGLLHDCLKLVYAGGDKLFVPVENIELLSRFGGDQSDADLDKLGGAGWQARKAKVKKDLMRMAEGLLKIAAERLLHRADTLHVESHDINEFAARFPYQETEDQQRAIDDTVADLQSGKPMDRLVCGDVGFGKTEIALRAAYVAAKAGAQVAIVAPTTLLARQHHQNFMKRLHPFGIRVEQLSRMVTAKEAKTVKEGIADGSVRVVVGTHALLASSVKFSNLGLVIVDEEQKFGVKQKERLKELKSNVHVLTLTATPIPRTLQMALTGVRDMSIIATPPVDRLAIRTFVMPFDPMVIREAIMREHYRGGQTFYVCPRIKDMEDLELQLKELVPEVKVITAHGQMPPAELEDRMNAFYDGQYNILLATNIIESGLDIPSANTIIVHKADLFGLAQLYQIRGRVGRSKVRAYAYITYDPAIRLNEQAQKRLEVFETLDSLGAGFQLASHDMDIRGSGNLLGDEQSGHVREVGVELYQQMLEEAVAASRSGTDAAKIVSTSSWTPMINVGTSVLIPEHYVEDLGVRMNLYRRLGELETPDDIEAYAAEMIDRFGDLPDEVTNLLDIVKIKQLCRLAGVSQMDAGPKGAIIAFHQNTPPKPERLLAWMAERPGTVKLRPDHKLSILRGWDSTRERVKGIHALMGDLARLAG
jgi:transcription-repair coupling factor (superfamily II helicase)